MNELQREISITCHPGTINFEDVELLQTQAEAVAKIILSTEVTDENVKDVKKQLASASKAVKAIEQQRIKVKKYYLEPYNRLEEKIKSITGTIKTAENVLRRKVKELEETHKYDKLQEIKKLWEQSTVDAPEFLKLEDFLTERHLNKTVNMKQIASEMSYLVDKVDRDLQIIKEMDSSQAILGGYMETLDLSKSIKAHQDQVREIEKAEQILGIRKQTAFYIDNEFIADEVEEWLNQHGYDYIRKEVQI